MSFLLEQKISQITNAKLIYLKGGMSAQICFAKYYAFKKGYVYAGWSKTVNINCNMFIQKSINKVCDYITQLMQCSTVLPQIALFSPGLCCVPYLIETCNLIYLPSHFLLAFTKISDLEICLQDARKAGYNCYAIMGYDSSIPNYFLAWIKFIEIPDQYIKLMNKFSIKMVIGLSVYDLLYKTHGQCLTRSYYPKKIDQKIKVGDIFILYFNESYGKNKKKDIEILVKIIEDVSIQKWELISEDQVYKFIMDWESGIDCLNKVFEKLPKIIDYVYAFSNSSLALYNLVYDLGKQFIKMNEISHKGFVYNPYFLSNPTYELNYGYYPILYWQFNPNKQKIIKNLIEKDDSNNKELLHQFNFHYGGKLDLQEQNKLVIQNQKYNQEKLNQWILKYKPIQYKLKYFDQKNILSFLSRKKLLYGKDFHKIFIQQ